MSYEELVALPEAEFTRLVNGAFKSYNSLLDLSRSPLAHSPLTQPALVLDALSPTADDRGRALRVAFRWAVSRLAPAPPAYPIGTTRPFDDPTWTDPLWWEYNLLRHRYIEPLTPDARDDLGERGFIGAICALTGIPDGDRFYAVRQQAISTAAHLLREQLTNPRYTADIQRLALEELLSGLHPSRETLLILAIAATFRAAFPRALLEEMADRETVSNFADTLSYALQHRLLFTGDDGRNLWMPPPMQEYLHVRQPPATLRQRHLRAAQHYRLLDEPLETAWHLRHGQAYSEAVAILLEAAPFLMGELQTEELAAELASFTAMQLPPEQWFALLHLQADVYRKLGKRDKALAACRAALRATAVPVEQAQIYHRLGKLYEDSNQRQALDYYQRALDRLPLVAPERAELLKDRAWIHIHRQAWAEAQNDLQAALSLVEPADWRRHADIHNAFASLYRQQKQYDQALVHAQQMHIWREESGDLQLTAEARSNLALIYAEMKETDAAIATYTEALHTFRKLGNREAIGNVLLNMGVTLHHANRLSEAISYYQQSLEMLTQIYAPLSQSQAYYNLAEAYSMAGNMTEGRYFWQQGYDLSQQAGLSGELVWYEELLSSYPTLRPLSDETTLPPVPAVDDSLTFEELTALKIAHTHGVVTNRALQTACDISKPTATRKLSRLVELGYVEKRGQGRNVQYSLSSVGRDYFT